MDRYAARSLTSRFAQFFAATALLLVSATLAAQPPVPVTDLKAGDWAEIPFGYPTQWIPVTIISHDRTAYKINQGGLIVTVCAYSTCIRHHTPTAAELATQQASVAAIQTRPTGPIGGKFGTREPASCPDRKAPPSAANAKQYFVCDWETNLHPLEIDLVGDVAIELASPRPFNWSQDRNWAGIDVRSVVYDARGKFTSYICTANSPQLNDFANTHNCTAFPYPTASGLCYKDNFGDWHCRMGFNSASPMLRDQMPPSGF